MSGSGGAPGAPSLGLLGKLPAHGDFIRRGDLPAAFCATWDGWLQDGIAAARTTIGAARWEQVWDSAPAWRFALPPGACGTQAVAGVLLPSRDAVGRRFPLTLAASSTAPVPGWPAAWFAALEGAARAALLQGQDADAVAGSLPVPSAAAQDTPIDAPRDAPLPAAEEGDPLSAFWARIDAGSAGEAEEPATPEEPTPPASPEPAMVAADAGWWTAAAADGTPGLVWPLPALPAAEAFVLLLECEA